jgi:hypothetical protein
MKLKEVIATESRTCKTDFRCDVKANHVNVCPRGENNISRFRIAVDLR